MPEGTVGTPIKKSMKYIDFSRNFIQDMEEFVFYMKCSEFKELPMDANVRLPEPKKSGPFKDMLHTLIEEPEKFLENNLGISVIASNTVVNESTKNVTFTFKHGTGILNGGHSQAAILEAQNTSIADPTLAIVKVYVTVKNYDVKRIAEIAASKNTSTPVKEYSLAEKQGLFAQLKNNMDDHYEKHIIWHQGRDVPNNKGMEADNLIAILNLFNVLHYRSENNSSSMDEPTISATNKSKAFEKWSKNTNDYYHIYPLINDIIDLYEYILLNFSNKTGIAKLTSVIKENSSGKETIFQGNKPKHDLPKQFLLPMLASFRSNIYYDQQSRTVGWYQNPTDVFDQCKKDLIKRLTHTYKTTYHSEINRASKDSNLWEILYNTTNANISKNKSNLYTEYNF